MKLISADLSTTLDRILDTAAENLRVRPETSGRIAEFSEHEAD